MPRFTFSLPTINNDPVTVTEADIQEARNLSSNAADVRAGLPPNEWNVTPEQLVRNRRTGREVERATGMEEGGANRRALEAAGDATRRNIEASGIEAQMANLATPGGMITGSKTIVMEGPPGSTLAQAQAIFRQQTVSGSLANLAPGSSLTDSPLAGLQLPNPTGALPSFGQSLAATANQAAAALTSTSTTSLLPSSPINVSEFAQQNLNTQSIGGLASDQVRGTLAQVSKTLGQGVAAVSATTGIGKFGVSPQQMELAGMLKPGTAARFLSTPPTVTAADRAEALALAGNGSGLTAEQIAANRQLNSVLQSPTVWTGKMVNNFSQFANDPKVQESMQQQLMSTSLGQLKAGGVITGAESPQTLAAITSISASSGVDKAKAWLAGTLPTNQAALFDKIKADTNFAVNLVDEKIPPEIKNQKFPPGVIGTVNRMSVDTTVATLIPSGRVSLPKFGLGTGKPVEVTQEDITRADAINQNGGSTTPELEAEKRASGLYNVPAGQPAPDEDPELRAEYNRINAFYTPNVANPIKDLYPRIQNGAVWKDIEPEWRTIFTNSGQVAEQWAALRRRALTAEPYSALLVRDIEGRQLANGAAQRFLERGRIKAIENEGNQSA